MKLLKLNCQLRECLALLQIGVHAASHVEGLGRVSTIFSIIEKELKCTSQVRKAVLSIMDTGKHVSCDLGRELTKLGQYGYINENRSYRRSGHCICAQIS